MESGSGPTLINGSVSNAGKNLLLYLGSHYYQRQDLFQGAIKNVKVFGMMPSAKEIQEDAKQ